RGEREGPGAQRWEGEVGLGERSGIPHLTPTLSAPEGGEGVGAIMSTSESFSATAAGGVEVRDLVVRYGDVAAVDGVSFTVGRGEHVTLLGPSGCGKTTTLRAIAGLEIPSAGAIRIGAQTVYSAAERRNVP